MHDMTIGQLAKAAGVHVETIRYYQRRGLLAEPRRAPGSVRRYGAEAAARVVESRLADLRRIRAALRLLIAQCDAGGDRSCPLIGSLAGASLGDLNTMSP